MIVSSGARLAEAGGVFEGHAAKQKAPGRVPEDFQIRRF
jgi:hypothetical protein